MAVAQKSKAAALAAAASKEPAAPTMFEVMLSTRKDLYGFSYMPGVMHTVDQATLDALGDAVAEKTQLKA